MKKKQEELDVDFIGGVRPLTKEDEQAISEYLKDKAKRRKKQFAHHHSSSNQTVAATSR